MSEIKSILLSASLILSIYLCVQVNILQSHTQALAKEALNQRYVTDILTQEIHNGRN